MASTENQTKVPNKTWKLRFSLRTFLLLPILVGLFFLAGQLTRSYGTGDVKDWVTENRFGGVPQYRAPLIFTHGRSAAGVSPTGTDTVETTLYYYVWFFGYVYELPWKSDFVDEIDKENSMNDIMERRLLGK